MLKYFKNIISTVSLYNCVITVAPSDRTESLMKSTGMVRNVDELGRIVIPKEMRRQMGISNSDPVEMYVEGDKIILEKYRPCCHFCSSSDGIRNFKGKNICENCISELMAEN